MNFCSVAVSILCNILKQRVNIYLSERTLVLLFPYKNIDADFVDENNYVCIKRVFYFLSVSALILISV